MYYNPLHKLYDYVSDCFIRNSYYEHVKCSCSLCLVAYDSSDKIKVNTTVLSFDDIDTQGINICMGGNKIYH